jgi:hypothetical protein
MGLFMRRTGTLYDLTGAVDIRYDLDALFKKKSGWMTVNVQGLSRVSCAYLTSFD